MLDFTLMRVYIRINILIPNPKTIMRLCPNPANSASVPNPSIPVWADGMFAYKQPFTAPHFIGAVFSYKIKSI